MEDARVVLGIGKHGTAFRQGVAVVLEFNMYLKKQLFINLNIFVM